MAENKVHFLRGTSTEYANAIKDDDTFYYTVDDEKFYVGSKEITTEGVTVDDTLSDTSEHPVQNKVIKAALDKKLDTFLKGVANGLAELDSSGKVPTSQLPSYVDDVLEGYFYNSKFYKESAYATEITGETGKIYIDLSTNKTYRWSGSAFVVISETLALGETSSTAYRGDRGKIAYDHSQTAHAPSNAEANQDAFSNVVIGSTTIAADSKTDTLTLVGSNVTLTPDATNDKVTIGITKANVTAALGYTPPTTNTTYGVATSSALGLIKSGTDITVDANGNVSVNDDSHNHIISNVDGLQSALDSKAVNKTLTNEDLNNITTPGFYNAGGGNTVTNKPSGVDSFGLEVIHVASGTYYTQILYSGTVSYRRYCNNGTWSSWVQDKLTDNDTKNTAGSTDTSSKIFLIGATSQAANPQTYSHDTAYVGTDGCLYSNGKKVVTTDDSRLSDARTPSAHNQASNTINAMTGYSKPSSTAAIATSDTLNSAIGKLEKALDGKAAVSHTHPVSEITDFPEIPAPTAFSVETASWTTLSEPFAGCGYSAEIAAEGVTVADFPDVYFDSVSFEAAANSGIIAATADGKIVFYAKSVPAAALSGTYFVRKGATE